MTDDDLLARADAWLAFLPTNSIGQYHVHPALVRDLAAALRARGTELAAALEDRDAYKALYDDLHEATSCVDGFAVDELRAELAAARTAIQAVIDAVEAGDVAEAPYSDTLPALRAWLASVATTPSAPEHELSADCWCQPDVVDYAATPPTTEVHEGAVWADPYLTEPDQEDGSPRPV